VLSGDWLAMESCRGLRFRAPSSRWNNSDGGMIGLCLCFQ
jgi:hypothetical protein